MRFLQSDGRSWPLALAGILMLLLPSFLSVAASPLAAGSSPDEAGAGVTEGREIKDLPWPMFGHDAGHSANAGSFDRKLSDPLQLWATAGSIESHGMAVGNFSANIHLNGTAAPPRRALHTAYAQNGLLTIAEATTGLAIWQAPLGGALLGAPALADFDLDGRLDVVVSSSLGNVSCYEPAIEWNGSAYSWNLNLTSQRLWDRSLGAEAAYSSAVLGDVSGDGVDDVALCVGHSLLVLNGIDGSLVWNSSLPGNLATSPVMVRYGEGGLWVAAQSFNYTGLTLEKTYLTLFNDKGQQHWSVPVSLSIVLTALTSFPSPAVADLDGNGTAELVFVSPFESGDGRLYACKQDGDFFWSPIALKGQCEAPPAVGDVDGDSLPELVTISWNSTILGNARAFASAIDGKTGQPQWTATIDRTDLLPNERAAAGPALGDLTGDGRSDVVVGLLNGRIYGLNGTDGGILWEHPSGRIPLTSAPSLADVQFDGFPELLVDGLVLTERIGDLSVGPNDISFSNEKPAEGNTISISAVVHDNGTKGYVNVTVLFSDIYDSATVWTATRLVNVTAGSTAGATVSWNAQGGGTHRILVTADPDGEMDEVTESNNQASRNISVLSHYTVEVSCFANESFVDAGQSAAYFAKVRNAGDAANTVNLTVSGLPPAWSSSVSPQRLSLQPNETSTITVTVGSPSGAAAGPYPANFTARSETSPANRATLVLTTSVRGRFGVSITPHTNTSNVMPDDWVRYRFNVSNTGNGDDTLLFANTSPPDGWLALLSDSEMALPARSNMELTLLVHPIMDAPEGSTAQVLVTVTSQGDPARTDTATTQTTVALPDLAVHSVRFYRADGVEADGSQRHLVDGGRATINVTVRNLRDNVDVGGVRAKVTEGDISLGQDDVQMLRRGEDVSVEISWRPAEGLHSLVASSDPDRTVPESDEANNNQSASVLVKSRSPSGPYLVTGVVSKEGGTPVAGAAIKVRNTRSNQNLTATADSAGAFGTDLSALPGGYQEEDKVNVSATDGITTCSTEFYVYSEDGGKQLDLTLTPGPYDFYVRADKTVQSVDPGATALYNLYFSNIGTGNNTLMVEYSALPSGWTGVLENSSGLRTSLLPLKPAGSIQSSGQMVFKLTPPTGALAGAKAEVRLLATSVNDSHNIHSIDTVTTVNQLYSLELSFEKGPAVKPGETARYNLSLRNAGNGGDSVELNISAPAGLAAVLDRTTVALGAFGSTMLVANITASNATVPGAYNITAHARSLGWPPGTAVSAHLNVTVEDYSYKLQLTGGTAVLGQQETGIINFSARNAGNVRDTYSMGVRAETADPLPAGWVFTIHRGASVVSFLTLEPGELLPLQLWVEPPDEIANMSRVAFNVTGHSEEDPDVSASATLMLTIERPDLLVINTVRASPSEPKDGQTVRLSVTVMNQGFGDSPPVLVRFLDGSKVIGEAVTGPIGLNQQTEASMNWTARQGDHAIKAVLNPISSNTTRVWELNYVNNEVSTTIVVSSAGTDIAWEAIAGFIVAVALVAGVYLYFTRRSRSSGARGEEGGEGEEEGGEDEESDEGGEEEGEEDEDEDLSEDAGEGEEEEGEGEYGEEGGEEEGGEEEGEEEEQQSEEGGEGEEEEEQDGEDRSEGPKRSEGPEGEEEEADLPLEGEEEPEVHEVHEVEAEIVAERPRPTKKPPGAKGVVLKKKHAVPPKKLKVKRPPPPPAAEEPEMPSAIIRIG